MTKILKKNKKTFNYKKVQHGGVDIITASNELVKSMADLGKSIFYEINAITNIQSDINNVSALTSLPSVSSPPQFNPPKL